MNLPSAPLFTGKGTEGAAANGSSDHAAQRQVNPARPLAADPGTQRPASARLPRARPARPRYRLAIVTASGLAVLILAAGVWSPGRLLGTARFSGPTWTVRKEKLKVSIIERGTLESARNGDIVCTVRSGTKGSTIATTIKWIIEPGVRVAKGDKLVELDSSGFVEQLKDQRIKVAQAKASWITANEAYQIQESQNESDIEAARNTLDLAVIDLEKYEKAEFLQALENIDGRIEIARADAELARTRAGWSDLMDQKGYQSHAQTKADKLRAEAAIITLKGLETERRVLVEYTRRRTIQDLNAKLLEARRALDRARSQAKAKLVQADADRMAKDSIYKQELSRMEEIEAEIAKCVIVAPQDGLVVYYVSDQARSGGGAQQSIVAQGEPVREGQKIMQIPDLSQMVVNVRVHEAMISTLHNEADPGNRRTWQLAQIRIDAVPNRVFPGHVKSIDTIASQQDWFASDVKLYKTVVSIDEPVDRLRPGMSAEVTINAEESPTEVMVVPVHAIVGSVSLGERPHCFVVRADGQLERRDLVLGMSNPQVVEIKSGLEVGEKVVVNPASVTAQRDGEGPTGAGAGPRQDGKAGGSSGTTSGHTG
jgi:multidrug resistance efflux pump